MEARASSTEPLAPTLRSDRELLDHGDEYFTISGHLADIRVEVGDEVESRGVIGTVGDTGSLSGPRLYFEVRHGREPQDPTKWLRLRDTG